MTIYLLGAFLLSLVCGFVFTPAILDYCKRKKLYDIPNERKVHKNAIPRMGGISFFPSMITAFLVVLLLLPVSDEHTLPITLWSVIFMLGLLLIYITGIIDDLTGLNAKTKFTVQIFTGCLLPLAGLYINNLYGLFGIYEIPYYIGIPLKDLNTRKGSLVSVIVHQGKIIIPFGKDHIEEGDHVIIVSRNLGISDLNEVLYK